MLGKAQTMPQEDLDRLQQEYAAKTISEEDLFRLQQELDYQDSPEYLRELGVYRYTEPDDSPGWQRCLKKMEEFSEDCQKILQIFEQYWRVCVDMSDLAKSLWLREKMFKAFPDFFTNKEREWHVLNLTGLLMAKGHRLLPDADRWERLQAHDSPYISCRPAPDVLFEAWTTSDLTAWLNMRMRVCNEALCGL